MIRTPSFSLIAAAVMALSAGAPGLAMAADTAPTMQQVVDAVRAGKLADAETLMAEVVKANPESAKAQFVYADVLAREGKRAEAGAALATAEKLEPALSFAAPASVTRVKDLIAAAPAAEAAAPTAAPAAAEAAAPVAAAAPAAEAPAPAKKRSWLPPVVFFLGALALAGSVMNRRTAGSKASPAAACFESVRRMFGLPA